MRLNEYFINIFVGLMHKSCFPFIIVYTIQHLYTKSTIWLLFYLLANDEVSLWRSTSLLVVLAMFYCLIIISASLNILKISVFAAVGDVFLAKNYELRVILSLVPKGTFHRLFAECVQYFPVSILGNNQVKTGIREIKLTSEDGKRSKTKS